MTTGFLQINGSGPANSTVEIFDADDSLIAQVESDARGFWSVASVELPVGAHKLYAEMRRDDGKTFRSPIIEATIADPDGEVEIQAEVLDPELAAVMAEMDAEKQERSALIAAFSSYDELLAQAASGYEVNDGELGRVLGATNGTHDEFWAAVSTNRAADKYSRLVLTAAAGVTLDDKDARDIWRDFQKTDEVFAADVKRIKRIASLGWNTSIDNE